MKFGFQFPLAYFRSLLVNQTKLMKFFKLPFSILVGFFLVAGLTFGQNAPKTTTQTSNGGKYTYTTVEGDPLKTRIYTLENGLTVYMSVTKNEPRVQTYIGIKAGSKSDPADATGLAHYLEHILFKGTDQFGSLDYAKEKPLLDEIRNLYEEYRSTKDEAKRKKIYKEIDRVSGEAAKFAIANEYDKMLAAIGAKGTNAFTSFEQTAYVNNIPSNQLEKWLSIEGERFRNPVVRIFHTELEAVYEEKNRSLDSDFRAMYTALFEGLFKKHNYGLQTTIGTIDHLKNPSIVKIEEYYDKYYVPNNMAICLAGDFDPERTIEVIDQNFGAFQSKEVEPYTFEPEEEITAPIEKEVVGPNAEQLMFAYRFPGRDSREAVVLDVVDYIFANQAAGLIDLNLIQKQKVLSAYSSTYVLNDYSMHMFSGTPREGQTLEEVRDLLLEQIEMVKKGEFSQELLDAVITNMEIDEIKRNQSNRGRAGTLLSAFTSNMDWADRVNRMNERRSVTKEEIVEMANKYYKDNYVLVYKRVGERDVKKVEKPEITPVEVNREAQSDFLRELISTEATAMKPVFLDYENDIKIQKLKNGVPVHYLKNEENDLFYLYYVVDMGTNHDRRMEIAFNYLPYLGTDKYTPEEIQKKMYNLGMSFNVFTGEDRAYVYLNGLQSKFSEGVELFEHLLSNAQPNEEALASLIADELKDREDAKKEKFNILYEGLYNYAKHGEKNPFNDLLSEKELKNLKGSELTDLIHNLTNFEHRVLYYGPAGNNLLVKTLNAKRTLADDLKPIPEPRSYDFQETNKKMVYFVEYDMVQAEVLWLAKSTRYDPSLAAKIRLYNEYYGGNMSSIIFQTIRESKALAYSTYSDFGTPDKKEDPFYLMSYVGTQADKIHEAIAGMNELMTTMPKSQNLFDGSKAAIKNKLETDRIIRTSILFNYENARDMGLDRDIRKDIYENLDALTFEDIRDFHGEYVSKADYHLLVMGSKEKIDLKELEQYGTVKEVTLEELFGY
jgi:predicted Zn-dependent peptidase